MHYFKLFKSCSQKETDRNQLPLTYESLIMPKITANNLMKKISSNQILPLRPKILIDELNL